mmetsp:Transcript_30/g.66  ORF Transcript_30/g.66 Transcript_30/m.66 type:complete len:1162 (-) Transcript_30:47-3532(-)
MFRKNSAARSLPESNEKTGLLNAVTSKDEECKSISSPKKSKASFFDLHKKSKNLESSGNDIAPPSLSSVKKKNHLSRRDLMKAAEKFVKLQENFQDLKSDQDHDTTIATVQRLRAENSVLFSRCRKLEAQNIIAAAQMIDCVTMMIGMVTAVVCYGLYIKVMWWGVDYYSHHTSAVSWFLKVLIATMPYIYNRRNYGVTYRRFHVFAVAFVMIGRIKLVRWRANRFSKPFSDSSKDEELDNQRSNIDLSTLREEGSASLSQHFGDGITEDDIWESNYEINARFLYSSVLRLRGLWTKTAQYMASRADFVPIAYVRELSKLQDEAPDSPWTEVERMLLDAGILDHFSFVEKTPIASASIGQVHVATLKTNNEKVVIKCQHPHAQTLLSDDFISLRIIAKIVGFLEPEYKFMEILMKEWADEAKKELDFRIEVDNLQLANTSIQNMNASSSMMTTNSNESVPFSVEIPHPMKYLCSKRVLVMTFCEGKRIDNVNEIEKCKVLKESIMNAVAQIFAYMMYVSDIFNGDPHPGNIFIRPGLMSGDRTSSNEEQGFTIVLLDWGLAKRLPSTKRIGFSQMTYAASTFDYGLMLDAFSTLGLKLKRENVAEDMEGVRFALRDMVPRETARKRIKSKMKTDIARARMKKKGERVPIESKSYPGEFFFFIRTNELLHGLGSRLGVTMNYLDVIKPFAEKGLNASLTYMPVLSHKDPIHSELIGDDILKEKVDAVLNRMQKDGIINGAQVCVIQNDKVLTHNVCGNMGSLKNHLPVRSDTVFLGFSVTKAVTAALAAKMVEDGYMTFDEPICQRIWPEFAPSDAPPPELLQALDGEHNLETRWRWKRSITLRHILTHTTGLWYAVPSDLSVKTLSSCEHCVRGFEYNPAKPGDTLLPISEPGTECTYQYLSFGWLVAGCVIGAYYCRHGERKTYQEIYGAIVSPLHSTELREAGFKPCGGDNTHDAAHVETDVDLVRFMQMKREAEAMGENTPEYSMDTDEANRTLHDLEMRNVLLKGIEGREFILDPRIWNSGDVMSANVPAAGGRFSAKGIALFYHELANGKIVSREMVRQISSISVKGGKLQQLQGGTVISNGDIEGQKSLFGLGFQIISVDNVNDGDIFGHAGVGGSVGLHHIGNNTSVGIMLNKVGPKRETVKDIILTISSHLTW